MPFLYKYKEYAAGIIAPIVITDRMIHAAASLPSKLSINDIKIMAIPITI